MFVTRAIGAAGDRVDGWDDEKVWQYGADEASGAVESHCFRPWKETLGEAPLVKVSSEQPYLLALIRRMTRLLVARPRYKNTIQNLIEATDKEIAQREGASATSYTEAVPLNWASAQRGDTDIKIKASVE